MTALAPAGLLGVNPGVSFAEPPIFESTFMKHFLASIAVPLLLLGQPVRAAEPLRLSDVTGVVQQWRPDSASITVSGNAYEMAEGVEFMEGAAAAMSRSSLKPGARVMLMMANGKVTRVIVNPVQPSPIDRPNK